MDKKALVLKTFNKQLTEFIDDVNAIFPGEKDVVLLSTFMKTIMFGKPRAIIEVWYNYITLKYYDHIEKGELEYFLNKDYSEDLQDSPGSAESLQAINSLRASIKKALEQDINKEKTIKYMQNLTKLANIYYSN